MASLIGINTRTGGIKQIPSRVGLYTNGVGLGEGEQHQDTITIVRDTRVFPDGEAPPDFNTFEPGTITWSQYGEYWYRVRDVDGGNLRAAWLKNPADVYAILNEQSGGEDDDPSDGDSVRWATQRAVDIEKSIIPWANADGFTCGVLNLAGGSPGDFQIWKDICAPFIMWAWENGNNLYCRHCYADWFVEDDGSINNGQPQRVINELEHLRSIGYGGGMVLTECGLYGGYGVAEYSYFEQQVTRWEQALRPYADILIGLAWWECGSSEFNADYTAHLKQLLPYIEASTLPRWTPPTPPPDNGENNMTLEWKNATRRYIQNLGVTAVKIGCSKRIDIIDSEGKTKTIDQHIGFATEFDEDGFLLLLPETTVISISEYGEEPDEPSPPEPPPVELTLPRGGAGRRFK